MSQIYENLLEYVRVTLRYTKSEDNVFKVLALIADKQTQNYDVKCSNKYPSQSIRNGFFKTANIILGKSEIPVGKKEVI